MKTFNKLLIIFICFWVWGSQIDARCDIADAMAALHTLWIQSIPTYTHNDHIFRFYNFSGMMMMTCYKTSDAYMLHVLLHTFNGNNNNEGRK